MPHATSSDFDRPNPVSSGLEVRCFWHLILAFDFLSVFLAGDITTQKPGLGLLEMPAGMLPDIAEPNQALCCYHWTVLNS
ncbi:hypothetical protein Y1Q_0019336 [Alligator mississippiensis]|uniref:Uncharacterized protein n=1 Tax=Alligator mississippiensis TaxID=8496 RepID=A0A151MQY1_ALLMI|nr:hypothetical protein Y1Q_0019336 [Alligator mississippiensis]